MDLSPAFAVDHLSWDGIEPNGVTHTAGRLGGGGLQTAVSVAKRRPVNYQERLASGGAYTSLDRVWLIPAAVLPANFVIRPGDTITDGSAVAWTVLEDAANKFGATWRCVTRDLVLVNALTYTIDIERAALQQDASGGPVRRWPPQGGTVPYSGIRASVQPLEAAPSDERGMRATLVKYQVVVDRQLSLRLPGDRVKWVDINGVTRYLDITNLRQPARIDELPVLDCELRPGG